VVQIEAALVSQGAVSSMSLRTLFLFEKLSEEQLLALAADSELVDYGAGVLFKEGDTARYFFVLVDGEVIMSRRAGSRDIETGRTAHRGAYCGATAAFIENPPPGYTFTVRTARPTKLVRIDAAFFGQFVRAHYPMAVHLLQGMIVDHEGVRQIIDQQHRIQAVGTLTAGLMHGLNNPAAAITRIADELRTYRGDDRVSRIYAELSPAAVTLVERLRCEGRAAAGQAVSVSPLVAAEREDELCLWLDDHGVGSSWALAPTLAAAGFDVGWLEHTAAALHSIGASDQLALAISAVAGEVETSLLISELAQASAGISAIVTSARQYSQLDSAPLVVADVHDLLDSTLTMMSAVIGDAITVRREYARGLPALACFATELNQAWTHILDNAVDAIRATDAGRGDITVRTSLIDTAAIRVQICDTGVGIPSDFRDRVFLPFFTTKPVGMGVGMGLDLAWRTIVGRHHGSLSVASVPGDTRFSACLPTRGAEIERRQVI
jgi:signal transduction histidine kinase